MINDILRRFPGKINGMIHCTGGGQTKCLKFGKQLHYIKDNLFPIPPLFSYIQKSNDYDWKDMATVYNLGHRLEIYTNEVLTSDIIHIANDHGIDAQVIGRCQKIKSSDNKLTLQINNSIVEFE